MSILDLLKEKSVEENQSMKIDYNKTAIIPLDYSKGSKGL